MKTTTLIFQRQNQHKPNTKWVRTWRQLEEIAAHNDLHPAKGEVARPAAVPHAAPDGIQLREHGSRQHRNLIDNERVRLVPPDNRMNRLKALLNQPSSDFFLENNVYKTTTTTKPRVKAENKTRMLCAR